MSRPRRFTAQQALQLIQQLDESNSGESGDDISASASESSCLSEVNTGSSNSDSDSDDGEIPLQPAMPLDTSSSSTSTAVLSGRTRGRGRGRTRTAVPTVASQGATVASTLTETSSTSTATVSGRIRQRGRGRARTVPTQRDTVAAATKETARDGTVWNVCLPGVGSRGRLRMQNVVRQVSGPTPFAKQRIRQDSFLTAFRLLIDNNMLRHIQQCTETEARARLGDNSWSLSLEELDAFIAVLYARGIYGASKFDLHSLWSKPWGPPFFTETMSRDRFVEIMRFLRFDIKQTRSLRLQSDKFALASEVWYKFINNSMLCYKPGEHITIDEQLFPTKARCRFTQYIASKPDKYGIKFWLAVDVKSKYLVNGFPYLGKDETRPPDQTLAENVVLRLTEPFKGTGINVTTDNFFTSLKLAHQMKQKK